MRLDGAVSIAAIAFGGSGHETLKLDFPTQVTSVFSGFGTGDAIDLAKIAATSLTYSAGTLTLFDANHSAVDTLAFTGTYHKADFNLVEQGGGTELQYIGKAVAAGAHLPDFLPHGLAPHSFDGAIENALRDSMFAGGRLLLSGIEEALLHAWHTAPPR